uniref:Uncharacterized protein n=1 Tax=Arundo donax TaxID=35708 RepID=A0A0A9BY80_ARUDO
MTYHVLVSHEVFFEFLQGLAARRNLLVGSHFLLDHQALVAPDFSLLLLLEPLHLFPTFLKHEKTKSSHSRCSKFSNSIKWYKHPMQSISIQ